MKMHQIRLLHCCQCDVDVKDVDEMVTDLVRYPEAIKHHHHHNATPEQPQLFQKMCFFKTLLLGFFLRKSSSLISKTLCLIY